MENPEEYKGDNFNNIEGAWDWHSRCIPETVYSPEELEYLMGEQIMFKKDFEEATAKLLSHLQPANNDYAVKVLKDRIPQLLETKSYSLVDELNYIIKLLQK